MHNNNDNSVKKKGLHLRPGLQHLFPPLLSVLTCVLTELVHGMQIDDVGREARVHLAEDHATTAGVAPDDCLDVMTDSRAVGPPATVLVQPFPYHHGRG